MIPVECDFAEDPINPKQCKKKSFPIAKVGSRKVKNRPSGKFKGPITWQISAVNRAEISARFPVQIFLKKRLRLPKDSFSPVCETRLEISARSNGRKNLM